MSLNRLWLAGVIVFSLIGTGHAQEPARDIVGIWRTIDDRDGQPRALVRIERHDNTYTGFLAGSIRDEERPNARCTRCRGALKNASMHGLAFLDGLRFAREGVYEGGHIVDPDSGAEYSCRAVLAPNGMTLLVRGFIGIPTLGRSQRWERVS